MFCGGNGGRGQPSAPPAWPARRSAPSQRKLRMLPCVLRRCCSCHHRPLPPTAVAALRLRLRRPATPPVPLRAMGSGKDQPQGMATEVGRWRGRQDRRTMRVQGSGRSAAAAQLPPPPRRRQLRPPAAAPLAHLPAAGRACPRARRLEKGVSPAGSRASRWVLPGAGAAAGGRCLPRAPQAAAPRAAVLQPVQPTALLGRRR